MVPEKHLPAMQLDRGRCIDCQACVRECPSARFHGYAQIALVRHDECLQCGHCMAVCPQQALSHATMRLEPSSPEANSPAQVREMLAQRRSIRNYAARPVAAADWRVLLEAMRYAPSGMNERPVQATLITDRAVLDKIIAATAQMGQMLARMARNPLGRMLLRLVAGKDNTIRLCRAVPELQGIYHQWHAGHDPIFHGAPAVMLLHAERSSVTGHDDCVLAAMSGMLAAPSVGLGTCLIGFALQSLQRSASLRRLVDLPAQHEVHVVMAVGYAATPYQAIPSRPAIPTQWIGATAE